MKAIFKTILVVFLFIGIFSSFYCFYPKKQHNFHVTTQNKKEETKKPNYNI